MLQIKLLNYGAAVIIVITQCSSYLTFNSGFIRQENAINISWDYLLCYRAIRSTDSSVLLIVADMSVEKSIY